MHLAAAARASCLTTFRPLWDPSGSADIFTICCRFASNSTCAAIFKAKAHTQNTRLRVLSCRLAQRPGTLAEAGRVGPLPGRRVGPAQAVPIKPPHLLVAHYLTSSTPVLSPHGPNSTIIRPAIQLLFGRYLTFSTQSPHGPTQARPASSGSRRGQMTLLLTRTRPLFDRSSAVAGRRATARAAPRPRPSSASSTPSRPASAPPSSPAWA